MVSMLISDAPDVERKRILQVAKDSAARFTDEYWQWQECGSLQELEAAVSQDKERHMLCIDLTMRDTDQALSLAGALRAQSPRAHMILIADGGISPVRYMRPAISAQSLMLKPLGLAQMQKVMADAVRAYAEEFLSNHAEDVFLVEYRGDRERIGYSRIQYFESRERKVFLYADGEEYGFYGTLEQLEGQLGDKFLRCHRSFLVNRRKIRSVRLSQNCLELEGGISIPLSRTYKPAIKEFMSGRAGA